MHASRDEHGRVGYASNEEEDSVAGLIERMSLVIKSKLNKLLDRAEDPAETLDYSYEQQLRLLQDVKRGVVDVTTSACGTGLGCSPAATRPATPNDRNKRWTVGSESPDLPGFCVMVQKNALVNGGPANWEEGTRHMPSRRG
jgi:hypothetical protein